MGAGACGCAGRGGDDPLYCVLTGSLRAGATIAPQNVPALRFLCDSKIPEWLLHAEAEVQEETILTAAGPLPLEWILPRTGGGEAAAVGKLPPSAPSRAPLDGGAPSRIILYMHGGAFVLCTPGSLRGCTSPIARATGAAVCVPEYRRPPEHSIAAAVEDGLAAYAHLVQAYPDAELWLGGESAGGGLAASMLAALRGGPTPLPRGAVLMSPWTDLTGDGPDAGLKHTALAGVDCPEAGRDYLPPALVSWIAVQARGDLAADRPPVSPMYVEGSLTGLPPIFVVYGKDEVLCGQIEKFCETWSGQGASLQPHGVAGGVHAPVLFNFCHGPSHDALRELSKFVMAQSHRKHIAFEGVGTHDAPKQAGVDAIV